MKNIQKKITILAILLTVISNGFAQKTVSSSEDYLVTISTAFGNIKILLYDDTPLHKQNFLNLARSGFYNHTGFHRIIDGFMIQGGEDTTGFSKGKPFNEVAIPAEFRTSRKHFRGAVSMARPDNPEKRSDRTQFFIIQALNGAHYLDNQYTVFGQVVSGMEVVDIIARQGKDLDDRPLSPIKMTLKIEKVKKSDVLKYYSYKYE